MTCPFRYVAQNSDISVNLHLFRTANGTPRGTVTGPVTQHLNGHSKIFELLSYMSLDRAFPSAIRMANKNDTEIVVTGDRKLWDKAWGTLGVLS